MSVGANRQAVGNRRGAVWRGLLVVVMLFLLLVNLRYQMLEAEVRRAQTRLSECDDATCTAEVSRLVIHAQTTCEALLSGVGMPLRVLGRTCEGR